MPFDVRGVIAGFRDARSFGPIEFDQQGGAVRSVVGTFFLRLEALPPLRNDCLASSVWGCRTRCRSRGSCAENRPRACLSRLNRSHSTPRRPSIVSLPVRGTIRFGLDGSHRLKKKPDCKSAGSGDRPIVRTPSCCGTSFAFWSDSIRYVPRELTEKNWSVRHLALAIGI